MAEIRSPIAASLPGRPPGAILEPFWSHFGATLELPGSIFDSNLDRWPRKSRPLPGRPPDSHLGAIWEPFWSIFDPNLDRFSSKFQGILQKTTTYYRYEGSDEHPERSPNETSEILPARTARRARAAREQGPQAILLACCVDARAALAALAWLLLVVLPIPLLPFLLLSLLLLRLLCFTLSQ